MNGNGSRACQLDFSSAFHCSPRTRKIPSGEVEVKGALVDTVVLVSNALVV